MVEFQFLMTFYSLPGLEDLFNHFIKLKKNRKFISETFYSQACTSTPRMFGSQTSGMSGFSLLMPEEMENK